MSQEDALRVFERFYRADSSRARASGLGLSDRRLFGGGPWRGGHRDDHQGGLLLSCLAAASVTWTS